MWSAPILNAMRQSAVKKTVAQRQIFSRSETAEIYPEFAEDPVGFSSEVLGIDLWEVQVEIALSVRDNPKTAVAACYASGKTLLAAVLTLWWLFTRTPAMVVSTAPTEKQVVQSLWHEVDRLHSEAKRRLGGKIFTKRARIDKNRRGLGFVGNSDNSTSGLHVKENALFIEDEAAGISPKVSAGFSGVTTSPNSRHLRIGNPICDEGPFWDCFNDPVESQLWKRFSISALDTPNVRAGKVVCPGLVVAEWVEEQRRRYGTNHPDWIRRVTGKFWLQMDGSKVVTKELLDLVESRWTENIYLGDTSKCDVLSADVAVGGDDDTVLYQRSGRLVSYVDAWRPPGDLKVNGKWQAKKIGEWVRRLKPRRLVVDFTGPGKVVGEFLEELKESNQLGDTELCLVNAGESAFDETYDRQSDELQWLGRRAMEADNPEAITFDPNRPEHKQLKKELLWGGYHTDTKRQVICCDSKRTIREKFGDSPDHRDAFNLLFYRTKAEYGARKNPPKALVL